MTLQPNAKEQKKIKKVSFDKIRINKNSPSMPIGRALNRISLLAALSFSTQLFCSDYDIFKEMLPLSLPIETPEGANPNQTPADECIWAAASQCRASIRAFQNATQNDMKSKLNDVQDCLWNTPCAKKYKDHS